MLSVVPGVALLLPLAVGPVVPPRSLPELLGVLGVGLPALPYQPEGPAAAPLVRLVPLLGGRRPRPLSLVLPLPLGRFRPLIVGQVAYLALTARRAARLAREERVETWSPSLERPLPFGALSAARADVLRVALEASSTIRRTCSSLTLILATSSLASVRRFQIRAASSGVLTGHVMPHQHPSSFEQVT